MQIHIQKKIKQTNKENTASKKTENQEIRSGDIGGFLLGCLQRMILSIQIDSDWRDTSEFMEDTIFHRLSEDELLMKWKDYELKLENYVKKLQRDSRGHLAKLRQEMSDRCKEFASEGNGIYRLSIPTGGGKTMAGFRYAVNLAKQEKKKHIYYIAPYLSILEQNAGLIRDILNDEDHVLEYHSNVIRTSESEEDERAQWMAEAWTEPVILTTMVQFLNAMFSSDMKSIRRFHQLTDSIIIIDEAQSIPVKCMCLFTTMMNYLSYCCNTTIVICTATQPLFESVKYPILYSEKADIIADLGRYQEGFKRTEIIPFIEKKMNTKVLADMVLEKSEKSILVILNTKAAVKNLYEEIKGRVGEDVLVYQLTTYMCAAHRMDIIEEIKELLVNADKKLICISTQLIEAGVDISFDMVIRSIAGLDSIAQAAGRCNRNAEQVLGKVYIVDYEDEKISGLKDIRIAQDATRSVILDKTFDNLLDQSAMDLYYRQYFYERNNEMEYLYEKEDTSLFELLSSNSKRRKHLGSEYMYPMAQAYRAAGEHFQVIDDKDSVGVIVPYKEAKDYVQSLKGAYSMSEIKLFLKKLQRYTVNVYRNDRLFQSLISRQAMDSSILDGKVYILDEGYYDEGGLSDRLELLAF